MVKRFASKRRKLAFGLSVAVLMMVCVRDRVFAQTDFLRGDVNVDGRVSAADAMMGQRHLFLGGQLQCGNALDFDDSGFYNVSDSVRILRFVFENAAAPPAPYPTVGPDPTSNEGSSEHEHLIADCDSFDIVEPLETEDTVEIGSVVGAPGEEVDVPIYVDSAVEVEGFQLVISCDPTLFSPLPIPSGTGTRMPLPRVGTYYAGMDLAQNTGYGVVTVDPASGVIVIGYVPDLIGPGGRLPPHTAEPALILRGTIASDAPAGTEILLEPVNFEGGYGAAGLRNELTHQGDARLVSVEPRVVGGFLAIVGDTVFFRGDANGDDDVDISDAEFTLDYLFVGGAAPTCLDAADANDDGMLNIADPVATLQFLFLGGSELPPPTSRKGRDPTDDGLGCAPVAR